MRFDILGSIPFLSMPGKETQENWVLQSVKSGKRRGVSEYKSGYLVHVVAWQNSGCIPSPNSTAKRGQLGT